MERAHDPLIEEGYEQGPDPDDDDTGPAAATDSPVGAEESPQTLKLLEGSPATAAKTPSPRKKKKFAVYFDPVTQLGWALEMCDPTFGNNHE